MAVNAGALRQVQFTDVSADETTGQWVDVSAYQNVTFCFKSTGTTSSGVITIEECEYEPGGHFALAQDKASSITTVNASDFTGGAEKIIHLTPAAYAYVRSRVSTAIGGGGTVSSVIRAV